MQRKNSGSSLPEPPAGSAADGANLREVLARRHRECAPAVSEAQTGLEAAGAELDAGERELDELRAQLRRFEEREGRRRARRGKLQRRESELTAEITRLQDERKRVRCSIQKIEGKMESGTERAELEQRIHQSESRVSDLDGRMREAVERSNRALVGYEQEMDRALVEFSDRFWSRLVEMMQGEGRERLLACEQRARLEAERKRKIPVRKVMRELQDWQAARGAPGVVGATAKREIARLEQWIEERYPGALSVPVEEASSPRLEIPITSVSDGVWVMLPARYRVVAELDAGESGIEHETLLRLIWAMAVRFPADRYGLRVINSEAFAAIQIKAPVTEVTTEPFVVPTPDGREVRLHALDITTGPSSVV